MAVAICLLASAAGAGTRHAAGQGRIEVAAVWSGAERNRFQDVLDAFTDKTGIDVTYTSTGADIAAALEPRIAADDAPDVAIIPQPGLLEDFARRGALVPIEEIAGAAVEKNYAPVWRELGTVDGTLYAVWFKGANKSLVWYNHRLYEDAGVRPADSFDALLESQETLADSGVAALAIGAADGWTLTDIFENVYLAQVGPDEYAVWRATRSRGPTRASRTRCVRWPRSSARTISSVVRTGRCGRSSPTRSNRSSGATPRLRP